MLIKYLQVSNNDLKTIAIKYFDKNILKERLFLDELTIDMLLDNFFLTLDDDLEKLQNAITLKNCEDISTKAHYIIIFLF